MAEQKTFSIIMATYNPGAKVERTLRSIFSQDQKLFELIIVDGASTDGTLERFDRFKDDIVLISEKDDGVYSAFNKGLDRARGRYIYFIGAGDVMRPGVLEKVKEFLPEGTPALVYGKCFFVKRNNFDGREFASADFAWTNICHQGEFYHRSVFDIVGKYDLRYRLFADWMLNLNCFLNDQIDKLFIPLCIADYEGGGMSSVIDNDPQFKKDFPLYIGRKLGVKAYVNAKFKMAKPDSLYFTYGIGREFLYEILTPVVPMIRTLVRGYRSLKSAVRK